MYQWVIFQPWFHVHPEEVLKRLAAAAPSCGLTVLEQRFAANVPLLVVGFVEDENVTDGITCAAGLCPFFGGTIWL